MRQRNILNTDTQGTSQEETGSKTKPCTFCKIINREAKGYTVFEDEISVAFLTIAHCCMGMCSSRRRRIMRRSSTSQKTSLELCLQTSSCWLVSSKSAWQLVGHSSASIIALARVCRTSIFISCHGEKMTSCSPKTSHGVDGRTQMKRLSYRCKKPLSLL